MSKYRKLPTGTMSDFVQRVVDDQNNRSPLLRTIEKNPNAKITLKEIQEKYPTGSYRQRPTHKAKLTKRWKDKIENGSLGAASGVRIIDPSTVDLSKYLDK